MRRPIVNWLTALLITAAPYGWADTQPRVEIASPPGNYGVAPIHGALFSAMIPPSFRGWIDAASRLRLTKAPFTLSPAEDAEVEQVLLGWERASAKIENASCSFHRINDNTTFASREEFDGELTYERPDRVRYRAKSPHSGEQVYCKGRLIYQWDYERRQILQHSLTDEQLAAVTAEGLLPFLFTAKIKTIRDRYFVKVVTPENERAKAIWIDLYPRGRSALCMTKATVILDRESMLPTHMQTVDGDRSRIMHTFTDLRLNEPIDHEGDKELDPVAAPGWEVIVVEPFCTGSVSGPPQ